MKANMHQIGLRQKLSNRAGKGFPQINRDRFDLRSLLSVQRFQRLFGRLSGSMFDHPNLRQIALRRDVMLTRLEAFFVNTEIGDHGGITAAQPSFDGK